MSLKVTHIFSHFLSHIKAKIFLCSLSLSLDILSPSGGYMLRLNRNNNIAQAAAALSPLTRSQNSFTYNIEREPTSSILDFIFVSYTFFRFATFSPSSSSCTTAFFSQLANLCVSRSVSLLPDMYSDDAEFFINSSSDNVRLLAAVVVVRHDTSKVVKLI